MPRSKSSSGVPGRRANRGRHDDLKNQMPDLSVDGHLDSGIAPKSAPTHLVVARILAPWGLRGEVKAAILTDFPHRFEQLERVYLGEQLEPAQLEHSRLHKSFIILKFEGLDHRDAVDRLKGRLVQIPAEEAIPLDEGDYYVYQIVGLRVWTVDGEYLGQIDEVLFTGSNEVYVVKNNEDEILIPAIAEVVRKVDLETGRLTVHLLEGLR